MIKTLNSQELSALLFSSGIPFVISFRKSFLPCDLVLWPENDYRSHLSVIKTFHVIRSFLMVLEISSGNQDVTDRRTAQQTDKWKDPNWG